MISMTSSKVDRTLKVYKPCSLLVLQLMRQRTTQMIIYLTSVRLLIGKQSRRMASLVMDLIIALLIKGAITPLFSSKHKKKTYSDYIVGAFSKSNKLLNIISND